MNKVTVEMSIKDENGNTLKNIVEKVEADARLRSMLEEIRNRDKQAQVNNTGFGLYDGAHRHISDEARVDAKQQVLLDLLLVKSTIDIWNVLGEPIGTLTAMSSIMERALMLAGKLN